MGAVREEPCENNLEGMAASISASVPGCQDSWPKVRTVAQKQHCRGLGRGESGRVICRDGILYHFSKIYKSLARWN